MHEDLDLGFRHPAGNAGSRYYGGKIVGKSSYEPCRKSDHAGDPYPLLTFIPSTFLHLPLPVQHWKLPFIP